MKDQPMKYSPLAGEDIVRTAAEMSLLADQEQCEVHAEFNDVHLRVQPGGDPADIVKYYWAESERRRTEWEASPEYAEQQRKWAEKEAAEKQVREGELADAPDFMSLSDPEEWRDYLEKNADDYGAAILSYAERWARIMEARIAKGETVEQCAEATSHIANEEGITGFMYGAAVATLSKVWEHGEQLRLWHNRQYNLSGEGDRANESGGVINPAVVTVNL